MNQDRKSGSDAGVAAETLLAIAAEGFAPRNTRSDHSGEIDRQLQV